MKKIFLSLLLFPCCSLIAQKINYQVIKDNPKMYFHAKAGMIFDGDFNKGNNRSGYIFQGTVNLGKRFSVSAEYQTTQQKWDNVNKTAVNIVRSDMFFSGCFYTEWVNQWSVVLW